MNLFTPRNAWGVIGTALALIALFLVLDNYQGANRLLGTGGRVANNLARTLQGR